MPPRWLWHRIHQATPVSVCSSSSYLTETHTTSAPDDCRSNPSAECSGTSWLPPPLAPAAHQGTSCAKHPRTPTTASISAVLPEPPLHIEPQDPPLSPSICTSALPGCPLHREPQVPLAYNHFSFSCPTREPLALTTMGRPTPCPLQFQPSHKDSPRTPSTCQPITRHMQSTQGMTIYKTIPASLEVAVLIH